MNDERYDAQDMGIPSVDEILREVHEAIDEEQTGESPADFGSAQYAPFDSEVPSYYGAPDTAETEVFNGYTDEPPLPAEDDFEPDFGDAFDNYGEYTEQPPVERQTEKPRKHLKRIRFPGFVLTLIWFALVVAASIFLANFAWECADDVLALTKPDQSVEIRIDDEDDLDAITEKLETAGVVEKGWLFKLYCHFSHSEDYFDPGVYNINMTYDYHALVNNLMRGASTRETATVMVMEGLDSFEIFDLLEENGICSRKELEDACANYEFEYEFLQDLPYGERNRLEGFLFPDTYQFYLNDEPEKVLEKFLDNFEKKFDEDVMELVDASGYSLREVLAMASIIEGEAANDKERPDVSSVMYNRLRNWENPLLGMDSTVYYAAKLLDTDFDLDLDSRYNTYRYPGLPEGPINNPGMSSVMAALQPNETGYYYFATAKDGLNRFFTNEEDFLEFLNSDDYVGLPTN